MSSSSPTSRFTASCRSPSRWCWSTKGGVLERPFFIMSRVDGGKVASVMMTRALWRACSAIGTELFAILGRIARSDPLTLPISQCFAAPAANACWREALDAWQAVIERDERHPQPIVRAAMRRLRRNPPKPAQKISVVHGDYRSGNFLHDGHGPSSPCSTGRWRISAIRWKTSPGVLIRCGMHFDDGRVAGDDPGGRGDRHLGTRKRPTVDRAALAWWKLFSAVKGCAIWTTSAKEFVEGGHDLVLGFAGTYTARRHDRIMADALARLVEEGWS